MKKRILALLLAVCVACSMLILPEVKDSDISTIAPTRQSRQPLRWAA